MKTYLDCWVQVATDLFQQALAGEPQLSESLPKPLGAGAFGFSAMVSGDQQGRFTVVLDGSVLESPLLGEGADQKTGWGEILKETFDAAAGELLVQTGAKCKVEKIEPSQGEQSITRAFQLKSDTHSWTVLVRDELKAVQPETAAAVPEPHPEDGQPVQRMQESQPVTALSPGLELLLDVELEAAVRFGCREMPLGEILDLGPGDVVQLDRNVSDPVDLIVGDKIVARGEVVLVNGNFGLRVSEVAAPKKRLESIRCLF
jgi:flagellar motor switch protein FliN/FliY